MKKINMDWSAILVCEIVFGFVGAIFAASGAVIGIFIDEIATSPDSGGNVYILPRVFGGISIVFLLVFATLFFITMNRKNKQKRLIENGSYINACVTEIKQDYFLRVNFRHPYYVICEGVNPYTGERLTFKSSNVLENPAQLSGQYLRVYLDYKNPKNYYVEINRNQDD